MKVEFFRNELRLHDRETGKNAALRQLGLGCKKFGILAPACTNLMNREMAGAYRETLVENGVPQKRIRRVFEWEGHTSSPDAFEEIDGLWCSHYVTLMQNAGRLFPAPLRSRKIHVDTICGIESYAMYKRLRPNLRADETAAAFRDWFASLEIREYSLLDIASKAAELAMQLAYSGPAGIPKTIYMPDT